MIKNLTPHEVNINGVIFPPSGIIARVSQKNIVIGEFDEITLIRALYGDVVDLPEYKYDELLIVSAMVRTALPDRYDLASPGDLIRDEVGSIIGCKNLIIN